MDSTQRWPRDQVFGPSCPLSSDVTFAFGRSHDLPRGCAQAQTAGRPSRVTSNPPATSKPVASVKLARKPRAPSPTGKSAPQSATRVHQQLPDRRSPDPIRHKPPESCLLPTARLLGSLQVAHCAHLKRVVIVGPTLSPDAFRWGRGLFQARPDPLLNSLALLLVKYRCVHALGCIAG